MIIAPAYQTQFQSSYAINIAMAEFCTITTNQKAWFSQLLSF